MSFFQSKTESSKTSTMFTSLEETKSRCVSFLEKLETRMEELCIEALPELRVLYLSDDDPYHRTYGRMASAIQGQLTQMWEKARNTLDEKVEGFFQEHIEDSKPGSAEWKELYRLRHECSERERVFEQVYFHWRDEIEKSAGRDLEGEYQHILDEYESIRYSFKCKQCGALIPIEKIYFIPVYLSCSHCNTQNAFEPSSKARGLEHLGRELAEYRTAHLLKNYEEATKRGDKEAIGLYETYLRAMFDEWNSIVPDLKEQNEKFYLRLLNDFKKHF